MNSFLYQAYCKSQTLQLQEQHSAMKSLPEIFQDTSCKVTEVQRVPQIQVDEKHLIK